MQTITIANEILLEEVSQLLRKGNHVTIRTKGNSMLPFIRGGKDRVTLVPAEELRKGDIVLAKIAPGHFVLHRIRRLEGNTVILMGDGNLRGTERCDRASIAGKVEKIIRPDGRTTDCGSRTEQRKARLWETLMPVRRILLAAYRRIYLIKA